MVGAKDGAASAAVMTTLEEGEGLVARGGVADWGRGIRLEKFFVSISQKGNSRCDDRGMCELGWW